MYLPYRAGAVDIKLPHSGPPNYILFNSSYKTGKPAQTCSNNQIHCQNIMHALTTL